MTRSPYRLAWFGCDLRTGYIIEDLPALKPTGALSRKLGVSTTLQAELPLGGVTREWEWATAPGRTLLVAVDMDTDTPLWAGAVLPRDGGSATTVQLGAATLEAYLDARYPGTQVLLNKDQADIVAALAAPALTGGPPFVIDAVATGTTMDYLSSDGDDKTILSCLTEVMGMEGGPEWTVDVVWNAGHNGFQFPLRVRKQIGMIDATPEAVFDFPGCVSTYSLAESYEREKGATRVIARGEGEGESRLTSRVQEATDLTSSGWPVWEHRYTPSSGITDPDQLNAHAARSLALMARGAQVWTMEAVGSHAPRLGTDWALGDSVRLAVETSPRHPAGATVVARCWAWELEPAANRVRPILVEE